MKRESPIFTLVGEATPGLGGLMRELKAVLEAKGYR